MTCGRGRAAGPATLSHRLGNKHALSCVALYEAEARYRRLADAVRGAKGCKCRRR